MSLSDFIGKIKIHNNKEETLGYVEGIDIKHVKEFIKKIKELRIVIWSFPLLCPICKNKTKLWIKNRDNPKEEMCLDCAIDKEAGEKLIKK